MSVWVSYTILNLSRFIEHLLLFYFFYDLYESFFYVKNHVYLLWLFFCESCRAETLLKYTRHYKDYIAEKRTSL